MGKSRKSIMSKNILARIKNRIKRDFNNRTTGGAASIDKQKDSVHYDNAYTITEIYKEEPEDIKVYYPMWLQALETLKSIKATTIVDLGCGPGHVAKVISNQVNCNLFEIEKFFGYDFSPKAIEMAKNLVLDNKRFEFEIRDLLNFNFVEGKPTDTVYISFEFLEHIHKDLEVLSKIPSGSQVIFSVPSFDYKSHVRFFPEKQDVFQRYSKTIDILECHVFNHEISSSKNNNLFLCYGTKT